MLSLIAKNTLQRPIREPLRGNVQMHKCQLGTISAGSEWEFNTIYAFEIFLLGRWSQCLFFFVFVRQSIIFYKDLYCTFLIREMWRHFRKGFLNHVRAVLRANSLLTLFLPFLSKCIERIFNSLADNNATVLYNICIEDLLLNLCQTAHHFQFFVWVTIWFMCLHAVCQPASLHKGGNNSRAEWVQSNNSDLQWPLSKFRVFQ